MNSRQQGRTRIDAQVRTPDPVRLGLLQLGALLYFAAVRVEASRMPVGDVVQSAIAAVGVFATLFVAWMVLRLERRDRVSSKQEDRTEADVREQDRRRLEEQRAQQARRYEHHRDDYLFAVEALEAIEESLRSVQDDKTGHRLMMSLELDEPAELLERLSRRLPELANPFGRVAETAKEAYMLCISIDKNFFFDAFSKPDETGHMAVLHNRAYPVFMKTIRNAILLDRVSRDGLEAVEIARSAIAEEWGDRKISRE